MDELSTLYARYHALVAGVRPHIEPADYSVLDRYIPFLEQLDAIDRSAISIFDLNRMTHVYASPSYRKRLGIGHDQEAGPEGFERLMHPDDHISSLKAAIHFIGLALKLPPEQRRNCKMVQEYRIRSDFGIGTEMGTGTELGTGKGTRTGTGKGNEIDYHHDRYEGRESGNRDGDWIRVVEQFTVIESDCEGNPWLSLSILDISPDQDIGAPHRATMIDASTGELFLLPDTAAENPARETLSAREREVLTLIADGFVSKEVADKLFLSVHTVNTHRRNIISKMDVSNTAEAIRQARDMALI
jgi:DNA-binding CsgD family transcriptional regulator